ncbi:MAG: PorP/SprF family type IX secretion system membrane protein [Saprospiraceae bacterium]|nr:PorP/SprF family type IX secretion system membrane protein [Saprospiraceae bacterium]
MCKIITNLYIRSGIYAAMILVLSGFNNQVLSQDLHYSQFYNAPMTVSPALTGIFNGDHRFTASLRDQWRSVPVPWFTFSASYDRKIYPKKSGKSFFGAGLTFNYDKQGDSNLALANVNLAGSYTLFLNDKNALTFGLLLGYSNRGFDPDGLTWDKQWDPATNSVIVGGSSGEIFDFETFSFLETAVGLNYRWQKSSRTKLDIGVGGFHLNSPKAKFNNNVDESLPLRLSIYGIYSMRLNDDLDLQLDAMHQRQRQFEELLFGAYLNFYLNQQRGKNFQFRVGAGYRTTQSFFPKVAVEYNNIFVAFSYDIDFSEFSNDQSVGGPEIHFRYIIKNVKPKGQFKICPIF